MVLWCYGVLMIWCSDGRGLSWYGVMMMITPQLDNISAVLFMQILSFFRISQLFKQTLHLPFFLPRSQITFKFSPFIVFNHKTNESSAAWDLHSWNFLPTAITHFFQASVESFTGNHLAKIVDWKHKIHNPKIPKTLSQHSCKRRKN